MPCIDNENRCKLFYKKKKKKFKSGKFDFDKNLYAKFIIIYIVYNIIHGYIFQRRIYFKIFKFLESLYIF